MGEQGEMVSGRGDDEGQKIKWMQWMMERMQTEVMSVSVPRNVQKMQVELKSQVFDLET